MDIYKIIEDYTDCRNKNTCSECEANNQIEDSSYTYCTLITLYGRKLRDKINELIEYN